MLYILGALLDLVGRVAVLATFITAMQHMISRVRIPGVKRVLTICSAKGGVGKSTTSVNTALALRNLFQLDVGLVDADITGPSIPLMMGIGAEEIETYRVAGSDRFGPAMNYGVKVMSMGLIVPQEEAIAVRGPMINKYMRALLFQTDWNDLDYLLVDMPPGTHDAHLTMTQEVQLSGAVIVSTPQEAALIDVRRGIDMFAAVNVPIVGLVENMSYFTCDQCEKKHYLFGEGGVRRTAEQLGVPFLGEIPLHQQIMRDGDSGRPPALRGDPDLPAARPYYELAARIHRAMDEMEQKAESKGDGLKGGGGGAEPRITFD